MNHRLSPILPSPLSALRFPPSILRDRWPSRISACLPLLLLLFLLTACSPPGADVVPTFVPPPAQGPPPGSTHTVKRGSIVETIQTRGRVVAKREVPLMFPIGGVLKAIYVSPGDQVRKGALLAELDAPEMNRELSMAQFDLELAQTELKIAELELEPPTSPWAVPEVRLARVDLDRAQAGLEQAQEEYARAVERGEPPEVTSVLSWTMRLRDLDHQAAQIRYSQAYQLVNKTLVVDELQLEAERLKVERLRVLEYLASERLSNTQLLAPLPGIVVSIEKYPGDQVASYESIGTVADPSELWIVATVLEEDVDRVTAGQPVVVRLDVYPTELYTGTVLQIVSQATVWQGRNAYEVTIAFEGNQDVPATIRMGADVHITGRSRENVLLVPSSAILTIGGREYVEIIGDEGDVERIEIQTGITDGTDTEVVSGLQAGQVIRIP